MEVQPLMFADYEAMLADMNVVITFTERIRFRIYCEEVVGELRFNANDQLHQLEEMMLPWKPFKNVFVRAFLDDEEVGTMSEMIGPTPCKNHRATTWLSCDREDIMCALAAHVSI